MLLILIKFKKEKIKKIQQIMKKIINNLKINLIKNNWIKKNQNLKTHVYKLELSNKIIIKIYKQMKMIKINNNQMMMSAYFKIKNNLN